MTKRNNLFVFRSKNSILLKCFIFIFGVLLFQVIACNSNTKQTNESVEVENLESDPTLTNKPKLTSIKITNPCPDEIACIDGQNQQSDSNEWVHWSLTNLCGTDTSKTIMHRVELKFEYWIPGLENVTAIEFANLTPENGKPNLHHRRLWNFKRIINRNRDTLFEGKLKFFCYH